MDTKPRLGEALKEWMGLTEAQKDVQRVQHPARSAALDKLLETRHKLILKYQQPTSTLAPEPQPQQQKTMPLPSEDA